MVDPASLSLAAFAAILVAKTVDRVADQAVSGGEAVLKRLAAAVRARFSAHDDDEGLRALERVEDAPDSPARLQALADAIDRQAVDPSFRAELEQLVEETRREGIDVGDIAQLAFGDQNVQAVNVTDRSSVNVSYGSRPSEQGDH
ncbi:MAG: hypothetical protein WD399_05195 [Thermoleophilaceae bacterium]